MILVCACPHHPPNRHHSTFPRLLSNALGQLLAFCGSHDQNVRLAAGDTLNKIIKVGVALCVVMTTCAAGVTTRSHEPNIVRIVSGNKKSNSNYFSGEI